MSANWAGEVFILSQVVFMDHSPIQWRTGRIPAVLGNTLLFHLSSNLTSLISHLTVDGTTTSPHVLLSLYIMIPNVLVVCFCVLFFEGGGT